MDPLTDVRQISSIAYGFIASKTLFAALNLDLFSRLSPGGKTITELAGEMGIPQHRLLTLLTACASLGLISQGQVDTPMRQRLRRISCGRRRRTW